MTDWTVDTLKQHFDALRAADQTAVRLQADKYESRLQNLNHENARLATSSAEMKAAYVSLDNFNAAIERLRAEKEAAAKETEIARREQEKTRAASRRNTIAVVVSIVLWIATTGVSVMAIFIPRR